MFGFKFFDKKWKIKRDEFLKNLSEYKETDEQFVESIFPNGSEAEKAIAIILRHLIAEDCGIDDADMLSVNVNTAELEEIFMDGLFLYALLGGYDYGTFYSHLSHRIRDKLGEGYQFELKDFLKTLCPFGKDEDRPDDQALSLGDWICSETQVLVELCQKNK